MQFKLISCVIVFLILTGCSTFKQLVFSPDVNQGNYVTEHDIQKLKNWLSQQQVSYILGMPILKNSFDRNTWFYIFRRQHGNQQVTQKTLILTFNSSGILTNIGISSFPA